MSRKEKRWRSFPCPSCGKDHYDWSGLTQRTCNKCREEEAIQEFNKREARHKNQSGFRNWDDVDEYGQRPHIQDINRRAERLEDELYWARMNDDE